MIKSFQYALQGLLSAIRSEANLRFHIAAAVIVIALGFWLQIRTVEWCIVVLCIGAVFGFELVNTSIEQLCNHVTAEEHPSIKKIKDISAAAVLLVSFASAVVGLLIFLPKLIDKF
ncbi:MAG: diacylglycerol kinase family protein [Lacibacter sp.]